jgi:hypothetical protein
MGFNMLHAYIYIYIYYYIYTVTDVLFDLHETRTSGGKWPTGKTKLLLQLVLLGIHAEGEI